MIHAAEVHMTHLSDYVAWRGDLDMSIRPFTVPDALVLTQLSYFSFPDASVQNTLHAWLSQPEERLEIKGLTDPDASRTFASHCAASVRFGNLRLANTQEVYLPDSALQFAACTYVLPDGSLFIAYRGTDQTLAGWKEDFMISFTKPGSQDLALQYLRDTIQACPDAHIRVAGHSKGGNLALYACAYLTEAERRHLEHVYLLDSPGFCPEVLDIARIAEIDTYCTRIVPGYSVIGSLFAPEIRDSQIVRSTYPGILQHDMMSWCVSPDGLDTLDEPDPASLFLNERIDGWIRSVSIPERRELVESLFDAMSENGTETLNAFAAKGITGFEDVFFRVAGLHAPARRAAMALPEHALFGSLPDQVRKSRSFRQFIAAIPLLDTLMILTGGLCHLLPEHFMNLMASLIVLILACVQLSAAIRRLSATHWNFRQQRPILSFSVLTAGLAVILFTKQSALFLLSSTIFGIGFLINAVMRSAEIREAGTWWIRLGHIFETGTSVLLGGFILLAPERTILWYMHACGTFLILDGVFRLLRYVASGKQPAAGSDNP